MHLLLLRWGVSGSEAEQNDSAIKTVFVWMQWNSDKNVCKCIQEINFKTLFINIRDAVDYMCERKLREI